jgi:hypothetical protein
VFAGAKLPFVGRILNVGCKSNKINTPAGKNLILRRNEHEEESAQANRSADGHGHDAGHSSHWMQWGQ